MLLKMDEVGLDRENYLPDALITMRASTFSSNTVGFLISDDSARLIEQTLHYPESVGEELDEALVLVQTVGLMGGEILRCELKEDYQSNIWGYLVLRDGQGREHQVKVGAGFAVLVALRTCRNLFMDAVLFDALVNEGLPEPNPESYEEDYEEGEDDWEDDEEMREWMDSTQEANQERRGIPVGRKNLKKYKM